MSSSAEDLSPEGASPSEPVLPIFRVCRPITDPALADLWKGGIDQFGDDIKWRRLIEVRTSLIGDEESSRIQTARGVGHLSLDELRPEILTRMPPQARRPLLLHGRGVAVTPNGIVLIDLGQHTTFSLLQPERNKATSAVDEIYDYPHQWDERHRFDVVIGELLDESRREAVTTHLSSLLPKYIEAEPVDVQLVAE